MRGAGELGRGAPIRDPSRTGLLAAALVVGALAGCGGGPGGEATEPSEEAVEAEVESAAESAASQPPSPERRRIPIQISYGETAEHTLAGGECHLLELELDADRYVKLEVEQLGLDLYTTVKPPGGGEALLFDAPIGSRGADRVAYVTEAPGIHRLEICPFGRGAAPTPYELLVEPPRAAGAPERSLARGFRRFSDGEHRLGENDPAAALERFGEALRQFEEAGARRPQAWAHSRLASVNEGMGDLHTATDHYRAAAGIYRELGAERDEGFVLSYLGTALSDRFRYEEAEESHLRSLDLAEAAGDRELVRTSLSNLALVHEKSGDTLQAVECHQRRRILAAEAGDPWSEWDALSRIGKVHLGSGDEERAQRVFEEGLAFARRHDLEEEVRESLQDLGRVHLDREEAREALSYFQEALEERKGSAKPGEKLATLLNNLGRCYRRLGERETAIEHFQRALEALPDGRRGGNARQIEAMILVNLASLYIFEGDFEAAAEPSERAVEAYRAAGSPILITGALKCLADVRAAQGKLVEAASHLEEVVETLESRRGRSAMRELRATLLEDKYHYYESYAEVLLRLHERRPNEGFAARAFEVAERAKARVLLDELAGTESEILAAADAEVVARKADLERRMSVLESEVLEARVRDDTEEGVRSIQARLRDLEAEHAVAAARIFADYPGWESLLQSEPVTLEAVREDLLGDGATQLVSFLLGDDRSHVWVVGRDSIQVESLPGRERIESLAHKTAALLKQSNQPHLRVQARLAAEGLSRELLGSVVPHLEGRKLLLIKDGALHYVPFAALPMPDVSGADGVGDGEELLVERFELVDLPSASAAAALRDRRSSRRPASGELAILADPVFEPTDERLRPPARTAVPRNASLDSRPRPLARATRGLGLGELRRLGGTLEEAHRISPLVPLERRLVALGFDANRDLLLGGRLATYRILHLAGHGLAHPDLTGLVLSLYDREGRLMDGLVRPYELYGTELSAELVVLSACSTGLGTEIRGEGLLGLSRGFLYAGASQVLASLWDVDDRATAELMERFYAALLRDGDPPARALRGAQRSLRRNPAWTAPHYWAGFVLQGDGR